MKIYYSTLRNTIVLDTKLLLKVVLFRGGLVPSIEPLKKYWVSEAMVLGMGWTKECIVL